MGLDAGVLGGIRLRVDDEQVPLAPRLRLLFALLVAAGESGVDADLLLEELYAGRPPPTAPAALRVHLAKLRDALEPGRDRAVSTRVGRSHDRWRLRLEPEECDATLFTAEVGQARALLDQGDHRSAVGLLQTALARWGEPYDGLPGAFFETERGRLAGLRRTAAVDLVHSLLEVGEATTARDEAGRLRADDPWDEELMLLQARATYAASGQEPALSLLRDFAHELDEELGLEPSPWLREAEQAVLRHDPAWAPVTATAPGQRRLPPPAAG
ncbi:AfsR/SARP family transcriptional regulator [Nocardioides euryhalodurans]|nr:BTAD domain-containing putative transcriptional regulator [Nocardioides euryhalodurans]